MAQPFEYLKAKLIAFEKSIEDIKQTVEMLTTRVNNIEMIVKMDTVHKNYEETNKTNLKLNNSDAFDQNLEHEDSVKEIDRNVDKVEKINNKMDTVKEFKKITDVLQHLTKKMDTVDEINKTINDKFNTVEEIKTKIEKVETVNKKLDTLEELNVKLDIITQLNAEFHKHINNNRDTVKEFEKITDVYVHLSKKMDKIDEINKTINVVNDKSNTVEEIMKKLEIITKKNDEFHKRVNDILERQEIVQEKLGHLEKHCLTFKKEIEQQKCNSTDKVISGLSGLKEKSTEKSEKASTGYYVNWGPEHDEAFRNARFVSTPEYAKTLKQDIATIKNILYNNKLEQYKVDKNTRFPITGVYIVETPEVKRTLNDVVVNYSRFSKNIWDYIQRFKSEFYDILNSVYYNEDLTKNVKNRLGIKVFDFESFEKASKLTWVER